jgi:pimeloyl-ACP methyl ester carboxylesterase
MNGHTEIEHNDVQHDETRLHFHRAGSGEPLVLLHGMGESHIGWRPVMDALAEEYDVIAIDLPGFGRSPVLPVYVPPTAANLAAAVESALNDLGIEQFHVAGYSLGARIAIHLAGTPRVKSAIAIGPDGLGTPFERVGGYLGLLAGRGVAMALAPLAGQLSQTGVGRMVFFSGNRSRPWQLEQPDAKQLLTDFASSPAYDAANWAALFDVPLQLFSVTQPILFLQGTADPITAQAMRYLPFIPHAQFRWLPGANHVPISDDPEVLAAYMLEFLQKS